MRDGCPPTGSRGVPSRKSRRSGTLVLSVQMTAGKRIVGFAVFSDENTAQAPLICRQVWRQMPLSDNQLRTKNQQPLLYGFCRGGNMLVNLAADLLCMARMVRKRGKIDYICGKYGESN